MKKTTLIGVTINVAISFSMFCMMFYANANDWGRGIVILAGNIFLGLIQISGIIFWAVIKRNNANPFIVSIVILQIIELILLITYGYEINQWLKRF